MLGQAFAHCPIFPTAASRRSLGRISVPMWPFILSDRLLIVAMVGRYPAIQLIRREPIFQRIAPLIPRRCRPGILCGISSRFQLLSPSERQVAHALLTRSPLSHLGFLTEISKLRASFDLHVLGTPPAFVLSQDQTLKYGILAASPQLKPIRAVCHSLFKRIVRELLRARLKNPSLVLFRISFYLHCLIYKVHSRPSKDLNFRASRLSAVLASR